MPAKRNRLKFQSELIMVFVLLIIVWVGGAVFYHFVEGLNYVDAIYFTACTLTTVGYGDITPKTELGKLFTALFTFVGYGFFLGFAAALYQSISGRLR